MSRPTCETCPLNVDSKCHKDPPVIDFTHAGFPSAADKHNPYFRRTLLPTVGKNDFCATHPEWPKYLDSLRSAA